MQKRRMGNTEEWVSLLGFGCMRFPQKDGMSDMTQVYEMIDLAIGQGVNYFDTAYVYGDGESERAMGEALRRHPRDSYFVADKLPTWMVKEETDIDRLLDTSLERLGLETIDFYLVHAMDKGRIETLKSCNIFEHLRAKKAEGKIRHIGFSFHDEPEVFAEIVDLYPWDFAQIQLNYFDWTHQRAKELYDIAEKKDLPCVVMEPVRGGALADPLKEVSEIFRKADPNRSNAAWALRFCASLPGVKTILSGMSSLMQVEDNVSTLANFAPMTPEERKTYDEAVACLNAQPGIDCTGCRYCMPCPKNVDIPNCFSAYNDYMKLHDDRGLGYKFKIEMAKSGPENCVKCGVCTEKCPQHLSIPEHLEKVVALKSSVLK